MLRDVVHHLIETASDLQLVAELVATTGSLDDLIAATPDVVIIDRRELETPTPWGVADIFATLADRQPRVRVIGISLADARVFVLHGQEVTDLSVDSLLGYVRGASSPQQTHITRSPERKQATA